MPKDYLAEQFVIIKRGLEAQYQHPKREYWLNQLNKPIFLKDVFQCIKIPLLCIYEDSIAKKYLQELDEAVKDAGIEKHTISVYDYFKSINNHKMKNKIHTLLILLPVEAKNIIIQHMLNKIWHMQSI